MAYRIEANIEAIGKLILIPTFLGDEAQATSLDEVTVAELNSLRYFIVENEKPARKFLKQAGILTPQRELIIMEYSKHGKAWLSDYMQPLLLGNNVGLLSDAGCPAIADPGAEIVYEAHRLKIKVVPRVGPNSILLALMASGFNGQSFCFHGYVPIEKQSRRQKLKQIETSSLQNDQTQIWIETPYRNNTLITDLLSTLLPTTELCIAAGLTTSNEFIKTSKVKDWRLSVPDLNKIPAVFLLYAC